MKTLCNILGGLLATVLSLVLICVLIVLPTFQGVTGLLQPKTMEALIEDIEPQDLLESIPELSQALQESGISDEAARALLECGAVKELAQGLAGDALKAVRGEFVESSLTLDGLKDLVSEYREELVDIILLIVPDERMRNEEAANLFLTQLLSEQGTLVIETINDAMRELQEEMRLQNVTTAIVLVTNGTVTTALIAVAATLALLIYLFRFRRAKGLVWLGVDAILAALPSLAIGAALMNSRLASIVAPGISAVSVIEPLLRRAGISVLICAAVLILLGALSITVFVLLRRRRIKKEAAAAQTALPDWELA